MVSSGSSRIARSAPRRSRTTNRTAPPPVSPSRPISWAPSDSVSSTLRPRARRKCFSVGQRAVHSWRGDLEYIGCRAVVDTVEQFGCRPGQCSGRIQVEAFVTVCDHGDAGWPRGRVDDHISRSRSLRARTHRRVARRPVSATVIPQTPPSRRAPHLELSPTPVRRALDHRRNRHWNRLSTIRQPRHRKWQKSAVTVGGAPQWQDVARAESQPDPQQAASAGRGGGIGAAQRAGHRLWVVATATGGRRTGGPTRAGTHRQPAGDRRGRRRARGHRHGADCGRVRAVGARTGAVRRTGQGARDGCARPAPRATSTTAAPAKAPTAQDVIAALRDSAASATELAAKTSGYRAGLLGSIAASCTAAYTVALVPPEKPQ